MKAQFYYYVGNTTALITIIEIEGLFTALCDGTRRVIRLTAESALDEVINPPKGEYWKKKYQWFNTPKEAINNLRVPSQGEPGKRVEALRQEVMDGIVSPCTEEKEFHPLRLLGVK